MIRMNEQERLNEEWHEHPLFNSQFHRAIWVKTWASGDASSKTPEGAPVSCEVCGRSKQ